VRGGLLLLPVLLLMAFALATPGAAVAAGTSTESGYKQEPKAPKEEKEGTSPSKESTTPTSTTTTPTSSTAPEKAAATLPFTGFDMRWALAIGLLLMGSGLTIVVVQRRQRGNGSR
jgi:LPXTG-motif cell wall-anchored protein